MRSRRPPTRTPASMPGSPRSSARPRRRPRATRSRPGGRRGRGGLQPAPEHAGGLSADLDAAAAALRAQDAAARRRAGGRRDADRRRADGADGHDRPRRRTTPTTLRPSSCRTSVRRPATNRPPLRRRRQRRWPRHPASGEAFTTARRPHDAGSGDGARPPEPVAVPRAAAAPSRPGIPVLRGALVKMAHEEPGSAARLLLALLPALRAIVQTPLDFDLTIRGTGTYAVTLGADTWSVLGSRARAPPWRLPHRRRRGDAGRARRRCRQAARPVARAGAGPRARATQAEALAAGVRTATLSLPEAVARGRLAAAGPRFPGLRHVIDPAWTRGHRFTVAQHVTGPAPTTMHVLVRDGAPSSSSAGRRPAAPTPVSP